MNKKVKRLRIVIYVKMAYQDRSNVSRKIQFYKFYNISSHFKEVNSENIEHR